jgi:diguanylate cyclase (GGDEF)-like protein
MELLLADSSRAHLDAACVHPRTGSPNCPVDSPYSCIACGAAIPQIFPDAEALNACPKLLGRMGGALSAACVPVNFMGRALGVLHVGRRQGQAAESRAGSPSSRRWVCTPATASARCAPSKRSQLQASTDSLTGLTNRRVGEEVLASLMTVDTAFAVVMADLDFFKRLNDTDGPRQRRPCAQVVRRHGAQRGARPRSRDPLGRRGIRAAAARRHRERAPRWSTGCGGIAQAHLTSNTPIFTASFGIADSTMARDRETIIRLADEALYRSKQAGRDRSSVADPQLVAPLGQRRERDQGAVVDITQVARGT